ncbi:hypothetical protein, partial [Sinorhizobium meliloti]|uniref:hypothetical protein n=1 Tax=Rhizobium meliloti TaxID=382 RepID=UPI001AECFD49
HVTDLPGRAPEDRSRRKLGKIQTAHLGSIDPVSTTTKAKHPLTKGGWLRIPRLPLNPSDHERRRQWVAMAGEM